MIKGVLYVFVLLFFQFCGNIDQVLEVQFLGFNDFYLVVVINSEYFKVFEVAIWNCQLCFGYTDIIFGVTVYRKRNLLVICLKVDLKELIILNFDIELNFKLKFVVK